MCVRLPDSREARGRLAQHRQQAEVWAMREAGDPNALCGCLLSAATGKPWDRVGGALGSTLPLSGSAALIAPFQTVLFASTQSFESPSFLKANGSVPSTQ